MATITIKIENAWAYDHLRDVLNALLAMKHLKENATIPDCKIVAGELKLSMTVAEDVISEQKHIRLHDAMDEANRALDDFGVRKARAQ